MPVGILITTLYITYQLVDINMESNIDLDFDGHVTGARDHWFKQSAVNQSDAVAICRT
jgi:hypothetical protein